MCVGLRVLRFLPEGEGNTLCCIIFMCELGNLRAGKTLGKSACRMTPKTAQDKEFFILCYEVPRRAVLSPILGIG